MTTTFPTFPNSGKNSTVEISTNDGQALVLSEMTKQASYTYRGRAYVNKIYLLGTGKTLINMRPEKQPSIDIDGIIEGVELSPAAAGKIAVSAGVIEVAGAQAAVVADPALALSLASAASTIQWNAIVVDIDDSALSVVAGTPSADSVPLLDTFGASAGQRPLVPLDKLIIGWVQVGNSSAVIAASAINYLEREYGGIDYEVLPNIGGCKLQAVLSLVHSATIGGTASARKVYFSGSYLDNVMSAIGTAKEWGMTANSTDVSDETFQSAYKQSSVSGFSVTFSQLAADKKVINAVFEREGHCAIRVKFPNGYGWQSSATLVPSVTSNPTSMIGITVTASLLDFPAESA